MDARRKKSRQEDFDNSVEVANVLANVAAVVVADVVVTRRSRLQRTRRTRHRGSLPGRSFRIRKRRSVEDVYNELGRIYFRRAYQMKYSTFKRLAEELRPFIIKASGQKDVVRPGYPPNGRISPDVRLACAIRWFAGGSAYDLMTTFGIGHTDTINSFWYVVDAINGHPSFNIEYPDNHGKQMTIAQGFHEVSAAGFNSCAGAIDGVLIWIHKPSKKDCRDAGCDEGKFYCGRKKKFGLNCQAVCDVRGRILDISVLYPGSTSDCLAFEGMSLFQKLEQGILAPGLCLFGDNAYINTPFMATPYPAVSGGTRDSYNFYHSQLRIRIECTFGMLTNRWSILRSAMPMKVTVQKTVALVVALAKLHNYCIDAQDSCTDVRITAIDEWTSELNGAVPLVPVQVDDAMNNVVPEQLMGGGHHFDDMGGAVGRHNLQRRYNRTSQMNGVPLPRERLHHHIESIGVTRPIPQPYRRRGRQTSIVQADT